MKLSKRVPALLAAVLLGACLSACSVEEMREKASDLIIDMATRFGFISEEEAEDDVQRTEAAPGGSITFPEDFVDEGESMTTMLRDGTLYIDFNNIRYKTTDYFVATSNSVTITAFAASTNTEAKTPPLYKAALWMLSEDMAHTSYVEGSTVYLSAAGENTCYTRTVSGLTPGRRYKVSISYDTTSYYVTGGMTVGPVSDEDLLTTEPEGDA